ncbi:hypothetical protein HK100_005000 [Physocladia obscura]|uniref:Uncharacterized protein n=1 Tax=Physocladia obscura TaxID=109957 RepID=A0AAD5ST47_9FUNG|nr:hypothetical protein HK100_005000 [Physocladia obscura]
MTASVKRQQRDDSARDGTVYSCQKAGVSQAVCSSYKCGPSLLSPSSSPMATLDPGSPLWTACPNNTECTLVWTPAKACSASSIFASGAEYLPPGMSISSTPTTTTAAPTTTTTTTTTTLSLSQTYQSSDVILDSTLSSSSSSNDPASEASAVNSASTTQTTVPISVSSDFTASVSPTLSTAALVGIIFAVAAVLAAVLLIATRRNYQKYIECRSNNSENNNENSEFYYPEKRRFPDTSESSSVASPIPPLLPTPTPPPCPPAAAAAAAAAASSSSSSSSSDQFPAVFVASAASFGTKKSDTQTEPEPPVVNMSLPKFYYNDTFFDSDGSLNSLTTVDNDSNIGGGEFGRGRFRGLGAVTAAHRISSPLSSSQPAQPPSMLLPLTAPLTELSSRSSSGWGGGIISKGPGALLRWGGDMGKIRGGVASAGASGVIGGVIIGGVIIGNRSRRDSRSSSSSDTSYTSSSSNGTSSSESGDLKIGDTSSSVAVESPATVGGFNQLSLSTGDDHLVGMIEGRGRGVTFEFEGVQFNANGPGSGPSRGGSSLPVFQ